MRGKIVVCLEINLIFLVIVMKGFDGVEGFFLYDVCFMGVDGFLSGNF